MRKGRTCFTGNLYLFPRVKLSIFKRCAKIIQQAKNQIVIKHIFSREAKGKQKKAGLERS